MQNSPQAEADRGDRPASATSPRPLSSEDQRDPASPRAESELRREGGGPRPSTPDDRASEDETAESPSVTVQLAETQERLLRALADFDNLRKRLATEVDQAVRGERARVAASWLPIVDNLDLALAHANADPQTIVEGVRAIRDQAVEVLSHLGFPRVEETGVPFEPSRHQAVGVDAEENYEPGTVVRVVRAGYGGAEQQLRPASVVVASKGS